MSKNIIKIDLFKFSDLIKTKLVGDKKMIWDPIRKKWLVLFPEEMVRQLLIQYFILECDYPKGRISVEKEIKFLGQKKRYDIIVYDQHQKPYLIVECKSFDQNINDRVLHQVAVYNHIAQAPYIAVSNGISNYCYATDSKKGLIFTDNYPIIK